MRTSRALSVVVLLALVSSSGCAHEKAWQVTGESLVTLGDTFVATAGLMDAALDSKAVTVEQYRRWATFVKYFKPIYLQASERWQHDGDTAAQHAAAVLGALAAELAEFSAMAAAAQKGGG